MRVLVACEESGTVRDAFLRAGAQQVLSCDLAPTRSPGPHFQGDVFEVLDYPWDLVIAQSKTYQGIADAMARQWTTARSIGSA